MGWPVVADGATAQQRVLHVSKLFGGAIAGAGAGVGDLQRERRRTDASTAASSIIPPAGGDAAIATTARYVIVQEATRTIVLGAAGEVLSTLFEHGGVMLP